MPRRPVEDSAWVTDGQGSDAPVDRPPDHGGGGFMQSLTHPPPVPALDKACLAAGFTPPPGSALALGRGAGCGGPVAAFGVGEMQAVFGADSAPGHQQSVCVVWGGDGERVDDPEIDPGDPVGVGLLAGRVGGGREFRGDVDVQAAVGEQQGHRPDCVGRVRDWPVQADL
ncbi:hypothetical protein BJ973_004676 [Actinoplanes tereljensis]|nr:hypothetical protein [Actinoplanes tereljensis]